MATQSLIEQAISKYSKGDDAYALKLKSHIREGMGYSNYMSRIGTETADPASIGDIKGLSPAGIKSRIASRFGDQDRRIGSLQRITGAMDTAAGSIAAEQIARSKAAASKGANATGFDNMVAFEPKSQLDQQILKYMQNPKNPDGSVKSLQQFESELGSYYSNPENMQTSQKDPNNPLMVHTPEEIKKTIEARLPKDFIGNEDKYHFMAQGYSQKQAKELQGGLRYDTMSEPEKLIYQVQNPQMAKLLDEGGVNKELLSDIGTTTNSDTGETIPKYTFDELKEKYPNVPEATLKPLIIPIERKSLQDDVQKWMTEEDNKNIIFGVLNTKPTENFTYKGKEVSGGWDGFTKTNVYNDFKSRLANQYSVFTAGQIEQIIYNTIMSQ